MPESKYRELPVETIAGLDARAILSAWYEANAELQAIKYRETQLRMMAFQKYFPDPKEGTNSQELGDGFLLKADHKFNYKLGKFIKNDAGEKIDGLEDALTRYEKDVKDKNAGERLVRWEPDISITEYKKVKDTPGFRQIAPFLSIKPGMPTLSVLAPGVEGNKK